MSSVDVFAFSADDAVSRNSDRKENEIRHRSRKPASSGGITAGGSVIGSRINIFSPWNQFIALRRFMPKAVGETGLLRYFEAVPPFVPPAAFCHISGAPLRSRRGK